MFQRIKWIDQAKGLAILMVVAVHVSQVLSLSPMVKMIASFGAMGVQLFFVLSAYCLCMTNSEAVWSLDYFVRKYRRLLPWYLFGIVLYFCYWWTRGDVSSYTIPDVLLNVGLVNGIVPSAQNAIVPGGWSISCIALFVFFFPGFRRMNEIGLLSFSAVGIAVSVVGYYCLGWTRFFAYCCPANQLCAFVAGVVFWRYRHRLLLASDRCCLFVGGLCFIGAVLAVSLDRVNAIFYRQVLMSISFICGLVVLQHHPVESVGKPLEFLGKHSYEIFITHFFVIWVLRDLLA